MDLIADIVRLLKALLVAVAFAAGVVSDLKIARRIPVGSWERLVQLPDAFPLAVGFAADVVPEKEFIRSWCCTREGGKACPVARGIPCGCIFCC